MEINRKKILFEKYLFFILNNLCIVTEYWEIFMKEFSTQFQTTIINGTLILIYFYIYISVSMILRINTEKFHKNLTSHNLIQIVYFWLATIILYNINSKRML